jgi:hypothetical protein
MLDEKIKEKIQKLLNLSLSDNEHESSAAMNKAMELMNKYDVSIDEVKKQPIISSNLELLWIYPPSWALDLLNDLCKVSGCYCAWKNGYSIYGKKYYATLIVTGRSRDVENTVYLCSFLMRFINNKINKTRREYTNHPNITSIMDGYRVGLIKGVITKIEEGQTTFFNTHNTTENALVPVNTKVKEAEEFYKSLHKVKAHNFAGIRSVDGEMMDKGLNEGLSVNIHQAVNTSDSTRLLGK